MFFYEKQKEVDLNLYEQYQVLCGIEEEFLILNEDGVLSNSADDIMVQAARVLEKDSNLLDSLQLKIRGLDAEPNPAQIEYVTLPLPPNKLEDAVRTGRKLLTDTAKKLNLKILAQSLHPIQSDPNPIVGTHINVSVQKKGSLMKPSEISAVYNYIWNMLPEIIAVSANSPVFRGSSTNIASNRVSNSTVLKTNGPAIIQIPEDKPALIPMRYYGRMRYKLKITSGEDEFSKKVVANPRGDRLMDITPRGPSSNIGDDKDETPTRNRIEVRIVDVQENADDLLDLAYLCCASGFHAISLSKSGRIIADRHHNSNLQTAIAYGLKSQFKRDKGGSESLGTSLTHWIDQTRKYQEYMGVNIKNLPIKKLERVPKQTQLEVEYDTRRIDKIRQQGRSRAVVVLGKSRDVEDGAGNKYKVMGGRRIRGVLTADYKFSYEELENMVSNFTSIKIVNYLDVQGLKIPLDKDDKIVNVETEYESLLGQLLGGFGF